MRLLLDTHTLIWWMTDDDRLPASTRFVIEQEENTSVASAASAWEMAIKVRIGRLPAAAGLVQSFVAELLRARIEILAMTADHAITAGSLPGPHRDPFDRMLIAQSQMEGLVIVSNDAAFDDYDVRRIW